MADIIRLIYPFFTDLIGKILLLHPVIRIVMRILVADTAAKLFCALIAEIGRASCRERVLRLV